MFIGHHAIGFASKKWAPRSSLLWLMAAPMLLDLLWPILLLAGIEHVRIRPGITRFTPLDFYDYPWSHSLVTSLGIAILVGGIYFAATRYGRGALVIGVGVVSHWILDFLTHRPDLPLWPDGPKAGLGLWNHPAAAIVIESALFAAGILLYRDTTVARDRIGSVVMWAFIVTLALIYIVNAGGAPPPNVRILACSALALWLFPLWAWWFDRHREVRAA